MQLLSHQSLCDLYSLLWFLKTSTMQYYHLQLIAKYLGGKKFHKRIAYSMHAYIYIKIDDKQEKQTNIWSEWTDSFCAVLKNVIRAKNRLLTWRTPPLPLKVNRIYKGEKDSKDYRVCWESLEGLPVPERCPRQPHHPLRSGALWGADSHCYCCYWLSSYCPASSVGLALTCRSTLWPKHTHTPFIFHMLSHRDFTPQESAGLLGDTWHLYQT